MDKRSGRDLLTDLPLGILHTILALVPIRDAIKTSILSRQWRYIWPTLPHLVFNDESVSTCEEETVESRATRLKDFINQALLHHKGPIHEFKIIVSFNESQCIDQWLVFLSKNDIRMLDLNVPVSRDHFHVPSSVYSCQDLTHLELFRCEMPPPPLSFNGFSHLRSLILKVVEVSCKAIKSIIASSPLLEELTLNTTSEILDLTIHVPNLKRFEVLGAYRNLVVSAPLLSKIFVLFPSKCIQQKSSACNYTNFLGGFANLEELGGAGSFIKYLSIGIESCHHSLVFHHLGFIHLSGMNFYDIKETWALIRLITGAPNLHKLIIISRSWQSPPEADISYWDPETAPSLTFERMKVILMGNVLGGLDEMKFIKFLLASSPVLETMTIRPRRGLDDHKLLTLTTELLRRCRASANAEILFSTD